MYGKIFEQIYNSTVCQDWKTLIVFQQCIILSDDLGILDMTPEAISRRTGIPIEIIRHGITELEKPDERSRSTKSEGRRLERMDDHRDWGWVVVNKVEYRKLASRIEKQENDRVRIANKRVNSIVSQPVASSRATSTSVANVAHTDTDTNTEKSLSPRSVKKPHKAPQTLEGFLEKVKEEPAYLHINIPWEMDKMRAWIGDHPKRKLTIGFVRNWLNKIEPPLEQGASNDPLRVEP